MQSTSSETHQQLIPSKRKMQFRNRFPFWRTSKPVHQHSRHHSIIPLLPEFDAADINKYTVVSGSSASTESAPHLQTDQYMQAQTPLRQLPQKRLFGNMFALVMDEQGNFTRLHRHWDGSPWIGFGHAATTCHRAYLATTARQEDVKQLKKDHRDQTQMKAMMMTILQKRMQKLTIFLQCLPTSKA